MIARLKGRLASFKVPKAVIVVDALPMTSTGKLQKNVLRKQYAGYYAQRESGK
ncbi:MAG: Long-chain-fatty-acid--CoA ligase [Labilithrix sp.]|nr:Long-chain-fatty-acid--CoA ligase [Labilithrix sp.]